MDLKFSKFYRKISVLAIGLFFLCTILPWAAQAKSKTDEKSVTKKETVTKENTKTRGQVKKPSKSRILPPKVEQALEIIQKNSDLKTMGQAIQRLKLNEKEKKICAREIKKQPYAGRLSRLAKSAQKKSESKLKSQAKIKIDRLKKQAKRNHTSKIQNLNRQATTHLATLKSKTTVISANTERTMSAAGWSNRFSDEPPPPRVNIRNVNPRTVAVGGNVTIEGENFGETERNIYVILDDKGYECEINSWSQTHINVTVPISLADLVGETTANAFICLVRRPFIYPLRITPVQDTLQPQITEISSETITPGQTLIIEGDRFLTGSQGQVIFRFDGRSIYGRVDQWTDDYVSVTLPENVESLGPVTGIVKLINHVGNEDSRSVDFEPTIISEILESEEHEAYAFWFFGSERFWKDNDFTLRNGWTVTRYWLEIEDRVFGGG